ncbi:MAG: hypothetical protein ACRC8A_07525 [Microcoleaceae cyanobacterium]
MKYTSSLTDNVPVERLPTTFETQPTSLASPLQPGCWAAGYQNMLPSFARM